MERKKKSKVKNPVAKSVAGKAVGKTKPAANPATKPTLPLIPTNKRQPEMDKIEKALDGNPEAIARALREWLKEGDTQK